MKQECECDGKLTLSSKSLLQRLLTKEHWYIMMNFNEIAMISLHSAALAEQESTIECLK